MNKGIKKTEQGKKLMFFSVSGSEYQNLLNNEVDILVKVDGDSLSNKLQEINSNYPRRMSLDLSYKYKNELEEGLLNSVEVVGKDKNIRKKPTKSDYLNGNSKLGKLIYKTDGRFSEFSEIGEFFRYIFHMGYVKGFSYSNPSQFIKREDDESLEHFTWDTSSSSSKEIFKEYRNCYSYLIQWSHGGKYSRVYQSDFKGIYSSYQGYSDDGYSYKTEIETSKPLKELYNEFVKQYNPLDFTDVLMDSYSPYGYWKFFEEYEPITWEECRETYEKIFVPIIIEYKGKDGFYGYDTINRHLMRDILLAKRGKNWMELEHGLWVKKYYLKEDVSKQDIVDIWWNDKKTQLLQYNPKISQKELEKERVEFDKISWGPESRLEEVFEMLNSKSNSDE